MHDGCGGMMRCAMREATQSTRVHPPKNMDRDWQLEISSEAHLKNMSQDTGGKAASPACSKAAYS